MNYYMVDNPADVEWQYLVETSPQGNIFSDLRYLRTLGEPFTCYLVKGSDGQVLCGAVILEDGLNMKSAPFLFSPHQGILFGERVASQSNHRRVVSEYRLTEFLIQVLIKRYNNFSMALSPEFTDLRPFLWYNYGQEEAKHFVIKTRYTAFLELTDFNLEAYLPTIRSVRRQEIKKSIADIKETDDVEQFMTLYKLTFNRQGIDVTDDVLSLVERIVRNSIADGYGRLAAAITADGIASMTLFIHDRRTGYYLFGANNPDLRSSHASTSLLVDNFQKMSLLGLEKIDFVGVNSPNRGDFKLSFNPKLKQYHEVHLTHIA